MEEVNMAIAPRQLNVVELILFSFPVWLLVLAISWATVGLPSKLLLSYLVTVGCFFLFFAVVMPLFVWVKVRLGGNLRDPNEGGKGDKGGKGERRKRG